MRMIQSVTPEYSWCWILQNTLFKMKNFIIPLWSIDQLTLLWNINAFCIMVEYGSNLSSSAKNTTHEDFLGSPVHFQSRGWEFSPWCGTKILHAVWCGQREKKKHLATHVSEISQGTVHHEQKSQVICKRTGTDNQNGFQGGSVVRNLPAAAGDVGSISGSGRSAEEGNDNPLQYSCLGNPMDRAAWWTTVHRVAKELDTT